MNAPFREKWPDNAINAGSNYALSIASQAFGLVGWPLVAFRRTSRAAALLLLPYLLWVAFASVLTWTVWRSNPGLL
jgi:tryptophan-rich sensory protein